MMLGSDGGIYSTFDGGLSMNHYYHIPLGEVYHVEADMETPYNIYIGLQDHETWKAPSNGWSGAITPADWVITGMWDGMYTKVDPENNRYIYLTTQFGSHHRVDQATGERVQSHPRHGKENRFTVLPGQHRWHSHRTTVPSFTPVRRWASDHWTGEKTGNRSALT